MCRPRVSDRVNLAAGRAPDEGHQGPRLTSRLDWPWHSSSSSRPGRSIRHGGGAERTAVTEEWTKTALLITALTSRCTSNAVERTKAPSSDLSPPRGPWGAEPPHRGGRPPDRHSGGGGNRTRVLPNRAGPPRPRRVRRPAHRPDERRRPDRLVRRFAAVLESVLEYVDHPPTEAPTSPQQRAHALLGRILDQGARERLPVIEWEIAKHGLITGRCFHDDHTQRPAELRSWADALGLYPWPEIAYRRGKRLQAVRRGHQWRRRLGHRRHPPGRYQPESYGDRPMNSPRSRPRSPCRRRERDHRRGRSRGRRSGHHQPQDGRVRASRRPSMTGRPDALDVHRSTGFTPRAESPRSPTHGLSRLATAVSSSRHGSPAARTVSKFGSPEKAQRLPDASTAAAAT
jgi:hypothetical protein